MKKWTIVLIAVAVLVTPALALAKGSVEKGHYRWAGFHSEQDYAGWGPACYYGQDVRIVYDATNTWTYVAKDGDVRETLVQNGTAQVYDVGGNLLDERTFHVTERFFDAGTDVAIRRDYGTNVWYEASHLWWSADLEQYHYAWNIPGVYRFRAWNRYGDWRYGWSSGDCEGGYPDGWPPHPPHPFNK